MSLVKKIADWERQKRAYYNVDLSTPENRRRAEIYNDWFDHAILRRFWTNFYQIAPGVWRSNQPTHARFEKIKAMGIQTVLNLRGKSASAHYYIEEESCRSLGLRLISVPLQARAAASREDIQAVLAAFRDVEKPFVLHCKSGADRAGFASAMWLMVMEGKPVEEALKMLSTKYIHFKWTKTGILDYILESYKARNDRAPISFEDWIATEYDREKMQHGFDNRIAIS